jgi:hypothetical protein
MLGVAVLTKFNPRVFGTMILTMLGIVLIILKIMRDYTIGQNTALYAQLTGIMLAFPIFIAIAITLIFHRLVFGYKSMIVMFVLWLIVAYVILTPVILGGI